MHAAIQDSLIASSIPNKQVWIGKPTQIRHEGCKDHQGKLPVDGIRALACIVQPGEKVRPFLCRQGRLCGCCQRLAAEPPDYCILLGPGDDPL